MVNKKIKGILVFGLVAVCAYAAEPAYNFITEKIMPDGKSAVVYFVGGKYTSASVWDGEKPVGDFSEKKVPKKMAIIPYKTTPGEHYFMFHGANWIAMRANLAANKRYIVNIDWIPGPFVTFVAANPVTAAEGEEKLLNHKNAKYLIFTDSWRADYAKGKTLEEAQKELKEAKGKGMEVSLNAAFAF